MVGGQNPFFFDSWRESKKERSGREHFFFDLPLEIKKKKSGDEVVTSSICCPSSIQLEEWEL